jgi:hypothetical protein
MSGAVLAMPMHSFCPLLPLDGAHKVTRLERLRSLAVCTEGVNGISSRQGGQRTIEITAGMLEVIDWLATAQGVEAMTGEKECEAAYIKYVGDGVTENTERHNENENRVSQKIRLQLITSPYQFYSSHDSICKRIDPDQVDRNRNASLTRHFRSGPQKKKCRKNLCWVRQRCARVRS